MWVKSAAFNRITAEINSQTSEKHSFYLNSFTCQKHGAPLHISVLCSYLDKADQFFRLMDMAGDWAEAFQAHLSRGVKIMAVWGLQLKESARHKAVHLYPEESCDRVGKLSTWDRKRWGEGWGCVGIHVRWKWGRQCFVCGKTTQSCMWKVAINCRFWEFFFFFSFWFDRIKTGKQCQTFDVLVFLISCRL